MRTALIPLISTHLSLFSSSLFSSTMETTQNFDCTVLNNNNNNNKSFSFLPSQPPFHVPSAPKEQQHSSQMSDSDSCSEDAGDAPHEEEELSLDEFLNDGNAKKKIELLAAMVGVNTTEPAIVLTEVVRALKLFNHYYKQF